MEVLGEPLEVALVEELDLDVRVPLAQLAKLAVLPGDERLLHQGDLDVQILLGEVEVRRERFGDAAVLVLFEDERSRLVLPGHAVVVQHLGALELGLVREPRWLCAAICLEIRDF